MRVEQRIAVDVSDADCSATNRQNERDQFYPIAMQRFNKGNTVRCSAIWQKMTTPSLKYELRTGRAPVNVINMSDKTMKPRQISVYRGWQDQEQLMVLWTNYETRNVSFDSTFYSATDDIPVNWLPGSTTGKFKPSNITYTC